MTDKKRLEYDGIGVWKMGGEPLDHYNLFQGYVIPAEKQGWPTIEHYLKAVLCSDDEADYDELIRLLRFVIRHPGRLPEITLQIVRRRVSERPQFTRYFAGYTGTASSGSMTTRTRSANNLTR